MSRLVHHDKDQSSINLSDLFAQLIKFNSSEKKYVMDETISSFLYYMFPRDLFIRALSLLESHDMFIYILDNQNISSPAVATHLQTISDETGLERTTNIQEDHTFDEPNIAIPSLQIEMIENFYKESLHESDFLFRLIIKNQFETVQNGSATSSSLVYVDILRWTCSCHEYSKLLLDEINKINDNTTQLKDHLLLEIDDIDKFSKDKFCQLDSFSLSKQRYLKYDKVMCPHLLAYAILLVSHENVLKYFCQQERNVFMVPIDSVNEWLKLHINIITETR